MSDDFVMVDGEEKRPAYSRHVGHIWYLKSLADLWSEDERPKCSRIPDDVFNLIRNRIPHAHAVFINTEADALDALREAVAKRDAAAIKPVVIEGRKYRRLDGKISARVTSIRKHESGRITIHYNALTPRGHNPTFATFDEFIESYDVKSGPEDDGHSSPCDPRKPNYLLQFFGAYKPDSVTVDSKFHHLATWLDSTLPGNPEKTVVLLKLLEARDHAVRCQLLKDQT